MNKKHFYKTQVIWVGNNGIGTDHYKSYERNHIIRVEGKPEILASSDPSFRGDKLKYNPEELLVSALSSCHMLWYLHLCAEAGVVVEAYSDQAIGEMVESPINGGKFNQVSLHPTVEVKDFSMVQTAISLHAKANKYCFIANSVNFEVTHKPVVLVKSS